jgi:hypothetical protein
MSTMPPDSSSSMDQYGMDRITEITGSGGKVTSTQSLTDPSKIGLDVNVDNVIGGSFAAAGLSTALKTQKMIVTDSPQKVPATPLAGRNAISIRVWGTNVVYFGDSTLTADQGYPKFQYEEVATDVKDNASVEIWAVCDTGKTCEIRIWEEA